MLYFGCTMMWLLLACILSLAAIGQSLPRGLEATVTAAAPHVPESMGAPSAVKGGSPIICLLCIDVIDQAKLAIKNPDLQENVKDGFLNGVCPLFQYNEGVQCRSKVKIYAPLVFDLVQNSLDPKTFCEDIALCRSDKPTPTPTKEKLQGENSTAVASLLRSAVLLSSLYLSVPEQTASNSGSSIHCDLCLFVVQEVVARLTSNTTEDQLIRVVDRVCIPMPRSAQKVCFQIVYDLMMTLIKMVVDGLVQPHQVCSSFHFCHSNAGGMALAHRPTL